MNISDYVEPTEEKKLNNNVDFEKIKQSEEFKSVEGEYTDLIEKFISSYGKMTEEELIAEMLKIVAEKKREGTFDSAKVRKLCEVISPFLSPEQVAKMNNLLNFLE